MLRALWYLLNLFVWTIYYSSKAVVAGCRASVPSANVSPSDPATGDDGLLSRPNVRPSHRGVQDALLRGLVAAQ